MKTAEETVRVLRRFKNAILEGPPGTGKTYVVEEIASAWLGASGRDLAGNGKGEFAITFHPSTTYEEFVEGLRYDDAKQEFVRRDGLLLLIIAIAEANPDKDYLLLIDEINRANVPKVLGDLLLCMESSKRSKFDATTGKWVGGMRVTLPYSGVPFSMPDNLYLLGTMNTSDRSIAPLDSALRRRFGFIRVEPIMGAALASAIGAQDGDGALTRVAESVDELTNLNSVLRDCLGPDAMLGHSYLFGVTPTAGATGHAPDLLEAVRSAAKKQGSTRGFWLQTNSMHGYSENQTDLPDDARNRQGIVKLFYPMTSAGSTTVARITGAGNKQDRFDVHLDGHTLIGNTVEYNEGGSNNRLKLQGKTTQDEAISAFVPPGNLQHKLFVWLARPDNTFDFLILDHTPENREALRAASSWSEKTPGTGGRSYGELDLPSLLAQPDAVADRSSDEDAEWMVWRYAILPQLIDTVTQLGVADLLDPATRGQVLSHLGKTECDDRLQRFDRWLSRLGLFIGIEGQGLSRGVVVSQSRLRPEPSEEPEVRPAADGLGEGAQDPPETLA
jgi:hypothetical protein